MSDTNNHYFAFHAQQAPEEKTKFFGLSIAVHASLAVAALFVSTPVIEKLNKEIITIEIPNQTAEPVLPPPVAEIEKPKGIQQAPNAGSPQQLTPAASAINSAELAQKTAGPVPEKFKALPTHTAKMKTQTSGGTQNSVVAKTSTSKAGVPETIEDIAAPDLNFESVLVAQPGKLGDDELEDDFKKIDKSNLAVIKSHKAELDNDFKQIADEKDEAFLALEKENQEKALAMEKALNATRAKNAATLAEMKAVEQAAAEKAAKQKQERLAAAALANKANGQGRGNGADQAGSNSAATTASGDPTGVRSLSELKQVPGNPIPQYSVEERRRQEQGLVAFYAYITKSGQPSQFKIIQSSGFRNLDGKTLAALKKWKFYPGQEGWVEIPFKWDIKGGVQEVPTYLRRSRYGSN